MAKGIDEILEFRFGSGGEPGCGGFRDEDAAQPGDSLLARTPRIFGSRAGLVELRPHKTTQQLLNRKEVYRNSPVTSRRQSPSGDFNGPLRGLWQRRSEEVQPVRA